MDICLIHERRDNWSCQEQMRHCLPLGVPCNTFRRARACPHADERQGRERRDGWHIGNMCHVHGRDTELAFILFLFIESGVYSANGVCTVG